ncbi:MAG: FHA domain-containing protein [Myxococcota bacterium]
MRVLAAPEDSILAEGALLYVNQPEVIVGRSDRADVLLPHESVSRRHARLSVTPNGIRIERLVDHNGLFVDEVSVDEPTIITKDQAVLQVGAVLLMMQRISNAASRTTQPVGSVKLVPESDTRFRVVWDAGTCTVSLDDRELNLRPQAAAFFGLLLESPDAWVNNWELEDHLGAKANLNQCATLVRGSLSRRINEGSLLLEDLVDSLQATLDIDLDATQPRAVLRHVIGNQRDNAYTARVGKLGISIEHV